MVKAILARTDFDYVMKVRAWSYVFDRVQGRPNHGLFCTARTEDREGLFQWVGPLASIKWTLFAAPDSDLTLERLEDARPLRIAGYKGDVMSQYLVDQGFNVIMSLSGDLNPSVWCWGKRISGSPMAWWGRWWPVRHRVSRG